MYVLLLKEGQKVRVGDTIRLDILSGTTGPLRIRFDAPAEMPFLLEDGSTVFPGEGEQLTLMLPERGTILIDGRIRIEVIEISPSRIRIGFDAPRTVSIALLEEVAAAPPAVKTCRLPRWICRVADAIGHHH